MATPSIPELLLQQIYKQAEQEYPQECCGMILGRSSEPKALSRVRPCKNVQNDYHQNDPQGFPRSAGTAYFIDPLELLAIQKEIRSRQEEIRVIYHSHINADAYFSDEDTRMALINGEPAYPDVKYLVISVQEGKAAVSNLFYWDKSKKMFL